MSKVAELYKQYRHRLIDYIGRRIEDVSDAEDIVQDVFMRLTLMDDVTVIENYAAWIWRTVKNRIFDYRKKHREEKMPQIIEEDALATSRSEPEDEFSRSLFWERLEIALAELPREQREAFVETELNGKTNQQLSAETGIPIPTLISRKHHAVIHLRHRLEDIYNDIRK